MTIVPSPTIQRPKMHPRTPLEHDYTVLCSWGQCRKCKDYWRTYFFNDNVRIYTKKPTQG